MSEHPVYEPTGGPRAAPEAVRTHRARVLAVGAGAVAAVVAIALLLSVPLPRALALLGFPILVGVLAWALYWRPRVELDPDALTFVDVVRTARIPWAEVRDFDVRFGLRVNTVGGRALAAWALPAAGRRAVARGSEANAGAGGAGGQSAPAPIPTGRSLRGELRPHMPPSLQRVLDYRRLAASGAAPRAQGIETHWHWGTLAAFAAALAWAGIALSAV
ncbi:hypothetical protein GSY69_07140 [Brevibacterium sp. 5221]|uniref:Low molecular weight protein antigen 6 PH domain-containing protein n=1 Tax=Brevibacterium rongguiense TaxID=2695267 RepID=A0A6N9H6Q7_9MICO|nr:PH domain-containing protein [Brevibacterium rongguiense]MYM19748.1 hypothetical protein [Brevibacterium rongguiense]